jgi:hypothetical protein
MLPLESIESYPFRCRGAGVFEHSPLLHFTTFQSTHLNRAPEARMSEKAWIVRVCGSCHYEKFYVKQQTKPPHTIQFVCCSCETVLGEVGPPPEPTPASIVGGRPNP